MKRAERRMNKNRTNCVVAGPEELGRVTDIGYCKERSLTFPRGLCSVQSCLNGDSLIHSSFYKYTCIIDAETRNIAQGKRARERERKRATVFPLSTFSSETPA